jgi:hypothetical protein
MMLVRSCRGSPSRVLLFMPEREKLLGNIHHPPDGVAE